MPDKPTRPGDRAPSRSDACGPPLRLVHEARASLRATGVYARALCDQLDLAYATALDQLDGIPADSLLHLIAVSDAFQDGARHTLWFIKPEVARNAQLIAGLARDGAGEAPAEAGG
jgi:hypothetical protein